MAVFGDNLAQLLLSPPVGQKRTMAIDPGFRNGCKIACLDEHGNLLHHEIIYPHPPQNQKVKSIMAVSSMVEEYAVEAIAIGNGTASRETEDFIKRVGIPDNVKVYTVRRYIRHPRLPGKSFPTRMSLSAGLCPSDAG